MTNVVNNLVIEVIEFLKLSNLIVKHLDLYLSDARGILDMTRNNFYFFL